MTREEFADTIEPWPADLEYVNSPQHRASRLLADIDAVEDAMESALVGLVEVLGATDADESEMCAAVLSVAERFQRSLRASYFMALAGCRG